MRIGKQKTMTATTSAIALVALIVFLTVFVSGIIFGMIELARWLWEHR
jgi:hypothetical protein